MATRCCGLHQVIGPELGDGRLGPCYAVCNSAGWITIGEAELDLIVGCQASVHRRNQREIGIDLSVIGIQGF